MYHKDIVGIPRLGFGNCNTIYEYRNNTKAIAENWNTSNIYFDLLRLLYPKNRSLF